MIPSKKKKLEKVFKLDKAPNLGIYFTLFSFYLGLVIR